MATSPVTASFAAFLTTNAYDQIRMGASGFTRANVKLVGSHADLDRRRRLAGGIEDMALMSSVPGMTVLFADAAAARALTEQMIAHVGPVYMRTGRPPVPIVHADGAGIVIGRAVRLREGADACVIACGLMVAAALEAAHALQGEESRCASSTCTPSSRSTATRAAAALETGGIVTAEEHLLDGGKPRQRRRPRRGARGAVPGWASVGVDDTYAESGKPEDVLAKYGLTWQAIASRSAACRRAATGGAPRPKGSTGEAGVRHGSIQLGFGAADRPARTLATRAWPSGRARRRRSPRLGPMRAAVAAAALFALPSFRRSVGRCEARAGRHQAGRRLPAAAPALDIAVAGTRAYVAAHARGVHVVDGSRGRRRRSWSAPSPRPDRRSPSTRTAAIWRSPSARPAS
ncbi:MAG: transketolase C-terminal domain-containing protein [Anaerolineae bacterium]